MPRKKTGKTRRKTGKKNPAKKAAKKTAKKTAKKSTKKTAKKSTKKAVKKKTAKKATKISTKYDEWLKNKLDGSSVSLKLPLTTAQLNSLTSAAAEVDGVSSLLEDIEVELSDVELTGDVMLKDLKETFSKSAKRSTEDFEPEFVDSPDPLKGPKSISRVAYSKLPNGNLEHESVAVENKKKFLKESDIDEDAPYTRSASTFSVSPQCAPPKRNLDPAVVAENLQSAGITLENLINTASELKKLEVAESVEDTEYDGALLADETSRAMRNSFYSGAVAGALVATLIWLAVSFFIV